LTCNGESESQSIKELIDLQDAFSNLSKKSIYSLKFDHEKSKVLKNIIEFKSENLFAKNSLDDSLSTNENFILKDPKSCKKFPVSIETKLIKGKKKFFDYKNSFNDNMNNKNNNEIIYGETSYI
jgi:hypothetical protein